MSKKSIVLTADQPAIEIEEAEWPVIARAIWSDGETPAASRGRAYVRVRYNDDGRYIVYGLREEGGRRVLGGRMVRGYADVTAAVRDISALVGLDPIAVFDEMPAVEA